jgi:hypothetical protein
MPCKPLKWNRTLYLGAGLLFFVFVLFQHPFCCYLAVIIAVFSRSEIYRLHLL